MVSKEDRNAYEDGQKEGKFISDHPIGYFLSGGIRSRPSDSSKAEAYDNGLRGDQLDEDKGSSGGDSSSGNSGGSGSGGCYLTTACVRGMGLPDDCLELNVLRNFRDNYLMPQPSGRKAVKEYYKIAPEIVQCINKREDAQSIWQATYKDIGHAVSLILSKDFEGAFKYYKQMTSKFQDKYLD